jgi:hypothetical protein
MVNKRLTVQDVAKDLAVSKKENAERWKTAFNEFADIKQHLVCLVLLVLYQLQYLLR